MHLFYLYQFNRALNFYLYNNVYGLLNFIPYGMNQKILQTKALDHIDMRLI